MVLVLVDIGVILLRHLLEVLLPGYGEDRYKVLEARKRDALSILGETVEERHLLLVLPFASEAAA